MNALAATPSSRRGWLDVQHSQGRHRWDKADIVVLSVNLVSARSLFREAAALAMWILDTSCTASAPISSPFRSTFYS